jgi:hypothetical protein
MRRKKKNWLAQRQPERILPVRAGRYLREGTEGTVTALRGDDGDRYCKVSIDTSGHPWRHLSS